MQNYLQPNTRILILFSFLWTIHESLVKMQAEVEALEKTEFFFTVVHLTLALRTPRYSKRSPR